MDGIPASQNYLESLTTTELIKLADSHGVDIPPDLDRSFIIEELRDLTSFLIEMEFDLEHSEELIEESHGKILQSAVLPKQYNITFLEVLVRDPLWVYAYWEIKRTDRELFEKAPDFTGYFLKIISNSHDFFSIPVEPSDNARYLSFVQEENQKENQKENMEDNQEENIDQDNDENDSLLSRQGQGDFRIELYAKKGQNNIFLAASNSFTLPFLAPRSINKAMEKHPLIKLSGIEDINIIRKADREVRNKRSGNPA